MSFLIALAAFACLSGGTYRQAQLLLRERSTSRRRLSMLGAGYLLLVLSLIGAIDGPDLGPGFVHWFGEITLAAFVVILAIWMYGQRAR